MQHDAHGRIHSIFLTLASATENHAGGADLLALYGSNVSGLGS